MHMVFESDRNAVPVVFSTAGFAIYRTQIIINCNFPWMCFGHEAQSKLHVLLSALIQCVCVHDITNDTPAM